MVKATPLEVTAEIKDLTNRIADAFGKGLNDDEVAANVWDVVPIADDPVYYIKVIRYLMYMMAHEFPEPGVELIDNTPTAHTDSGDYTYPPGSA